jgi:hypothetical protein
MDIRCELCVPGGVECKALDPAGNLQDVPAQVWGNLQVRRQARGAGGSSSSKRGSSSSGSSKHGSSSGSSSGSGSGVQRYRGCKAQKHSKVGKLGIVKPQPSPTPLRRSPPFCATSCTTPRRWPTVAASSAPTQCRTRAPRPPCWPTWRRCTGARCCQPCWSRSPLTRCGELRWRKAACRPARRARLPAPQPPGPLFPKQLSTCCPGLYTCTCWTSCRTVQERE